MGRGGVLDGMHILLVEDSKDVRDAFALLLRTDGATVVAVGTGRKAIEMAEGASFDVVLSDYGLPDMAGDDLIRALGRASPETRTIVVTGYGEPYVTRARRAGADAVFTKPVEWSRIVLCLCHSRQAAYIHAGNLPRCEARGATAAQYDDPGACSSGAPACETRGAGRGGMLVNTTAPSSVSYRYMTERSGSGAAVATAATEIAVAVRGGVASPAPPDADLRPWGARRPRSYAATIRST